MNRFIKARKLLLILYNRSQYNKQNNVLRYKIQLIRSLDKENSKVLKSHYKILFELTHSNHQY